MPNIALNFRVVLLVVGSIGSTAAWAVDPATIAQHGAGQATACATCHGKDGGGQASFPRLAGMEAAYLLKQLQDFASGSRANRVMQPIAEALSPADRTAIASYYAALPIPPGFVGTAQSSVHSSSGAQLATRGRWSNGIPACVQCHGPGGNGVGENFPAIAGQPAGYIAAQLVAWKTGTRKNDPLGLMQQLSRRLSEDEIRAVSEWFASQPAIPGTRMETTTPAAGPPPSALAAAASPALVGNARHGRQLVYTCSGCHGIVGYKNAYPSYHVPRIGGQSTQYLLNALNGYRSGARKHPTMQAQTESLTDQNIVDIAFFLTTVRPAKRTP